MSLGVFVNFTLPYAKDGVSVSAQQQAAAILQQAEALVAQGAKGVGITYSANYGQTREIAKVYFAGGWQTQIAGANQAAVMSCMESLLGSDYRALQSKMRVLPITTMNAYDHPVQPWNDDLLMGIVVTDLDRIKVYLEQGWYILGWQNQDTVNSLSHPYAVGGGVARLPRAVSDKIQQTLIKYAADYAK